MLAVTLALGLALGFVAQVEKPGQKDQERPSHGLAWIISGAAVTGFGVANLVTTPICLIEAYNKIGFGGERGCIIRSLVIAGVIIGVGVPLLITGLLKRSRYKEWQQQNKVSIAYLPSRTASKRGGALLAYTLRF